LAVRGLAWRLLMLGIVWLLVNVVFGFAETYYFVDSIYGGFSERLSHVDALYLTVGILSTAGSSIGVNSPLARSIVIVQMVTDLVLIGGVGAVVVSRFRGER